MRYWSVCFFIPLSTVRRAAGESAEIMNQIPEDKRAMAAKLAEAYACGLATGMEISENAAAEETAKN